MATRSKNQVEVTYCTPLEKGVVTMAESRVAAFSKRLLKQSREIEESPKLVSKWFLHVSFKLIKP